MIALVWPPLRLAADAAIHLPRYFESDAAFR
jgi:hypothetical protein